MAETGTFYEVLQRAVKHFSEHGYRTEEELEYWTRELQAAMDRSLPSPEKMAEMLRASLRDVYDRLVGRGAILRHHAGVSRFQLDQVAPRLRSELDRRILASANLIRLNRQEEVAKTLRRFSGWATSIPRGGEAEPSKRETANHVYRALRSLPFRERRVLIDQGHKLNSSISAVLAQQTGAIAAVWRDHGRYDKGYDARPEHMHRDRSGRVYLVRDSWLVRDGYARAEAGGYTGDVTQPAEEPFCRCWWEYLYSLRDVPAEMLTAKGREKVAEMDEFRRKRS